MNERVSVGPLDISTLIYLCNVCSFHCVFGFFIVLVSFLILNVFLNPHREDYFKMKTEERKSRREDEKKKKIE